MSPAREPDRNMARPLLVAALRRLRPRRADAGFVVPLKRRVIERTFGRLKKARRLVKADEHQTTHGEPFIYTRASFRMLHRLCPNRQT